jgi:hypothetical protein
MSGCVSGFLHANDEPDKQFLSPINDLRAKCRVCRIFRQ